VSTHPTATEQTTRFTVVESAQRLHHYHYAWYRLLHITAAWIPAVPEIAVKSGLGRALYLDSLCTDMIRQRRTELRDDQEDDSDPPNPEYLHFTNAVARLNCTADRLHARKAWQDDLQAALEVHLDHTDPLWDEPSLRMIRRLKEYLDESNAILTQILPLAQDQVTPELAAALTLLEQSGGVCGPQRALGTEDTEEPFNLVDTPKREPVLSVKHASEFPRARDVPKEQMLLVQLHSIAYCVEVVAVELCSQVIAAHPEFPWAGKMDLARQIWDEARHTELLTRRIEQLGGKMGDYPVHIHIWEYFYMGDDLIEQLCIQQVIQEGHGLDSDIVFSAQMAQQGDMETSVMFDFIGADEVIHVRLGCRWMTHFAHGDTDRVMAAFNSGYEKLLAQEYSPRFAVQEKERLIAGMNKEQVARARQVVFDVLMKEMLKKRQQTNAG
jgi:uncharacterized ferritin-like protein (DUF455 family)